MRNKIVMRRAFAEDGVPQPPFAAVRSLGESRRAVKTVGLPAVLKPADSGGQRGVFRIESEADLERHLHAALAESASQECILEGFVDGTEMNGIVIARGGVAEVVTLSDRLRPPDRLGVGWIHDYPASVYGDQLERSEHVAERAVSAQAPQASLSTFVGRTVTVVEVARIPGGQMADPSARDGRRLVDIASVSLGEPVPDEVAPAPAAARDPVPHGRAATDRA
jgi:hypothetical protein